MFQVSRTRSDVSLTLFGSAGSFLLASEAVGIHFWTGSKVCQDWNFGEVWAADGSGVPWIQDNKFVWARVKKSIGWVIRKMLGVVMRGSSKPPVKLGARIQWEIATTCAFVRLCKPVGPFLSWWISYWREPVLSGLNKIYLESKAPIYYQT